MYNAASLLNESTYLSHRHVRHVFRCAWAPNSVLTLPSLPWGYSCKPTIHELQSVYVSQLVMRWNSRSEATWATLRLRLPTKHTLQSMLWDYICYNEMAFANFIGTGVIQLPRLPWATCANKQAIGTHCLRLPKPPWGYLLPTKWHSYLAKILSIA